MTEGNCFYFPPFISFSLRSVSYSLCMSSGNCLIITDERLNVLSGIAGAPIHTLFGSLILPENTCFGTQYCAVGNTDMPRDTYLPSEYTFFTHLGRTCYTALGNNSRVVLRDRKSVV